MAKDETKLKFYGLLKSAYVEGNKLDLDVVSEFLTTPKATLSRWANEFTKLETTQTVLGLIDLDQLILNRILDEAETDVAEADLVRLNEDGSLEVVRTEETDEMLIKRKADIAKFRESVDGLKALDTELQATAFSLVGNISEQAMRQDLTPRDIASLTSALTNMQNAFFNKPVTNVQVNQLNGENVQGSLIDAFKERLKS